MFSGPTPDVYATADVLLSFGAPGDEPLYTQEVDCVSAPVLAAHARHTVLLPPGETVAECFSGDGSSETAPPEQLDFEVCCWVPDSPVKVTKFAHSSAWV